MVSIAEVSKVLLRKHTNSDRVTCLPVDTIVNEVISSPLVKNLWCNIIQNCEVETSKACQSLCLENVVKLYVLLTAGKFVVHASTSTCVESTNCFRTRWRGISKSK